MGLTWPPDFKEDPGFPERVDYLGRRQLEIAWYHSRLFADDPTTVETTKDLNMSMGWQSEKSSSVAQCLVSTSRPWLMIRGRSLCGVEALMLQGFPVGHLNDQPTSFPDSQLIDLAGNAFNGYVCLAVCSSLFGTCDLGAAIAVQDACLNAGHQGGDAGEETEEESIVSSSLDGTTMDNGSDAERAN